MYIGIAAFELHIESAQSLKDKRTIVRSLRDRVRRRFEVSVAEVDLNDLHQRARMGVAVVSNKKREVTKMLDAISSLVESESDARVIAWTQDIVQFELDERAALAQLDFNEEDFDGDEEDTEDDADRRSDPR